MKKRTWINALGQWINRQEQKVADMLNRKTRDWSVRKWKTVLVVFCLVSGTLTVYSMIAAFDRRGTEKTMTVTPVTVPKYTTRTVESKTTSGYSISESEYNRLRQFDRYVDSLKNSMDGRPAYDSIIKFRSGLLDTIKLVEQLYLEQKP